MTKPQAIILACASAMLLSCGRGKNSDQPGRYVLLIVIDTLRADALSCLADGGISTPNIDELAQDSVLFTQARSPSSWTLPSMASMMTGMPVAVHRATNGNSLLPRDLPTIGTHMRDAGFKTESAGVNGYLQARTRMNRGLQQHHFPVHYWYEGSGLERPVLKWLPNKYRDEIRYNATEYITRFARHWLNENADTDFFLWLHYYDPHLPYSPPPRFAPDGSPPPGIDAAPPGRKGVKKARSKAQRRWVKRAYLGEVQWVDEQVGLIVDNLKRLGIYEDTLIVLTSDHGEEFWEHGGFEHGHSLIDEIVHVPLLVKLPRWAMQAEIQESTGGGGCSRRFATAGPGKKVDAFVTTMGIMPMILDLCGIDNYDPYLVSHSLSPFIGLGEMPAERPPLFAAGTLYGPEQEMVLAEGIKYTFKKDEVTIVDLLKDPAEKAPLPDPDGVLRYRGEALLRVHHEMAKKLRGDHGISDEGDEVELDEQTLKELEALGYIL